MKKMTSWRVGLIAAMACFTVWSSTGLFAGNLLVDPGFELQTPPEQGGWSYWNGWFSADFGAHSGQWAMLESGWYSVAGSVEQFPAAPGSQWRLTGYGMAPFGLVGSEENPAYGIVQFTFFDIFGNDLGTVETQEAEWPAKLSNPVDPSAPAGEWVFLDTGVATAPTGAAYIQAFTIYVEYSGKIWEQWVCFDDLDLEIVGMNHGQYVSSIAHNADLLKRAGLITGAKGAAMVEAAALSAGGN